MTRPLWRRVGTWAAVSGLIALAIVGYLAIHRGSSSPPLKAVNDQAARTVPRFRLITIYDRRLVIPAAAGGAIAFVDASACRACVATASALARAARQERPGFAALLVDSDWRDRRPQLSRFLRAAGSPSYPVVLDTPTNEVTSAFGISTVGTVVVYQSGGRIVASLVHPNATMLARALRRAGL